MFDFYDSNYSDEFKQRLQNARCKKKFSQQDFKTTSNPSLFFSSLIRLMSDSQTVA